MDFSNIFSAIGTLGYPIVISLILLWYVKEQNEQHKEELLKLSETLNNNTIAITKLTAKLEEKGDRINEVL